MNRISREAGHIPESEVTSETVFWNRRKLLGAAGVGLGMTGGAMLLPRIARPSFGAGAGHSSADLAPHTRNGRYTLDRPLTAENAFTTYTNYYEFGSSKTIWRAAQKLPLRPWNIVIDGAVEKEQTIAIDDLLADMPLEERVYRLRCVEAWSMAVPWIGFPLRRLVERARPLGKARFLKMETFNDPSVASGQRAVWYPWPYREGLTVAEATNELAFIAIGAYGKHLMPQNGAPLRLVVPWKFGFKSIKGIVRFTFTESMPETFWSSIEPSEYGFWANVNPEVPHRRWSQASERFIRTEEDVKSYNAIEKRPTLLYNGYAEQVAHLYSDEQGRLGDALYR